MVHAPELVGPGWFPDPERPGGLRYFDGWHWTYRDFEWRPSFAPPPKSHVGLIVGLVSVAFCVFVGAVLGVLAFIAVSWDAEYQEPRAAATADASPSPLPG